MANSHIRDFALEYCFSPVPPHYALLLKGPWGSGKTWFVERLIEEINKKDGRELYISLYGLNSFAAIEYEFYRKLHPVLSSKGMEIAGKVLKGALRTTLKIDLDMDGKNDGSASISIPDLNLPEYLKNTSDFVMIFDDVERCSIDLPDLLGYINHFVEHQNYKVILVANEAEFEQDNNYKSIKEKLIGKTFEIAPQLDEALDKLIHDTEAEDFYEPHRELIKETYNQSKYKNLRHLRQALLDFTRLELRLPEDVTQSRELMAHLLRTFLIFTFEIRHGEMAASDIRNLQRQSLVQAMSHNAEIKDAGGERSLASKLIEKYPGFDTYNLLVEEDVWIDILDKGVITPEIITSQLKNTKYLISKSSPNWVRLWNFRSHTDHEFKSLVAEVWAQFEGMQFTGLNEIKHIFGMMLFFSEKELFVKSIDEICAAAKMCVDHVREIGSLSQRRVAGFRENESALGLGYISRERTEFISLCQYIRRQEEEAYTDTFPSIGEELLMLLRTESPKFSQRLYHSNYSNDAYYDIPIMASIEPRNFVDALLTVQPDDLYDACRFFRERYRIEKFAEAIIKEHEWVITVKALLEREIISRAGTLFGYCLKEVLENSINKALEDLAVVHS